MKNLYIMGTGGSGKTAIAVGLALKIKQLGYRVAYFKPVGNDPGSAGRVDEDAALMKQVLNLEHPLEIIAPCRAGPSYLSGYPAHQYADDIRRAYNTVARGADVIIIGGAGYPHVMSTYGLDAVTLARELNAIALFMVRIRNDFSIDKTIFLNTYLRLNNVTVAGNIFNNVHRPLLAKTEGIYRTLLEQHGFRTLGIVPVHPEIAFPTVAEYYEAIGGELLTGADNMQRPVEDVVIGAMTMEGALGYLRRAPNKAFVTGGDRADLALAALETSTSVLILTGGLYPNVRVLSRAAEKGVPVILVHLDTYTTVEKINILSRHIRPGDTKIIEAALYNIERYCDWQSIVQSL